MLFTLGGGDNRHVSRIRIEMLKFASLLKNTGDTFLTFQHFIHFLKERVFTTTTVCIYQPWF